MNLVLLLAQVLGHRDEGLEAHDPDDVLLVLRKLTEYGQDLLQNVLLFKLGGEDAELRSARPPDHRLVFIAQLDKLLSQFLLVRTRPRVALGEQLAAALAGWEPFTLC